MRQIWVSSLVGLLVVAVSRGATDGGKLLRVYDRIHADELVRSGAALVEDYGSFQLLRSPEAAARGVTVAGRIEVVEGASLVRLNTGTVDTSKDASPSAVSLSGKPKGRTLQLVQFAGPVKGAWLETFESKGVRCIDYIPNNAYLIYGPAAAIDDARAASALAGRVQWVSAHRTEYRIQPNARLPEGEVARFTFQLVADPVRNASTRSAMQDGAIREVRELPVASPEKYLNLLAELTVTDMERLAARSDVIAVRRYVPRRLRGERQGMICAGELTANGSLLTGPGYLAWLMGKGFSQAQFDASDFVTVVVDDGFDNGNAGSPANAEFRKYSDALLPSRVAYADIIPDATGISSPNGIEGHGNINVSIIGGYNTGTGTPSNEDAAGYNYGLGISPFGYVASTKAFTDTGGWGLGDEAAMVDAQYGSRTRISSDSWGADTAGDYDSDCQNYDRWTRDAQPGLEGNQEMTFVFSSGNAGSGASTVNSPGGAKNVITVGAAENVNPTGTDGCAITDAQANSANDIASFSSRGPCADGRHKPDIAAPGTHIHGAASYDSGYNGNGICDQYDPAGQTKYALSSGTSHSTPAVAGGAALVRQYFINQAWPVPSPAMLKAYLMNSARYLTGVSANDSLWSDDQGMGGMNLGAAFDGVLRRQRDQLPEDVFTDTGQVCVFTNTVASTSAPVRVTLAWSDAPGSVVGNAWNNDLDLEVLIGGTTYRGNVFAGAQSQSGGAADPRNNVESVFLGAGQSGEVVVTVRASNITSDGLPGNSDTSDQDFALLVYNATPTGPSVQTHPASNIETNSLTLRGRVNPVEMVTTAWFEYGLDQGVGATSTGIVLGAGTVGVDVSNRVQALPASTRYFYRVVASNAAGVVAGEVLSARTLGPAMAPEVDTLPATALRHSQADLEGVVNPNFADAAWRFEYGPTESLGMTTDFSPIGGDGDPVGVSTTITGLAVDSLYHYRAVATNAGGVTYGDTEIFGTSQPAHTLLEEDFEHGGSRPPGWTEEYVSGTVDWLCRRGGINNEPPDAHGGDYNACFFHDSYDQNATRLISPVVDFGPYTNNTTLTFWHVMKDWLGDWDDLRVFVQSEPGGSWVRIAEWYRESVEDWTERVLTLPNPSSTYRIAFEGTAWWGYGTCVDDVRVTGVADKIPSNTTVNAVSRLGEDGFVVQWSSVSGHVYDVEAVGELPGMFTSVVENVVATPPVNSHTDEVDTAEQRFYRIRGRRP